MKRFNKGDIVTIIDSTHLPLSYQKLLGEPLVFIRSTEDGYSIFKTPTGETRRCYTFRLEHYKLNLENE